MIWIAEQFTLDVTIGRSSLEQTVSWNDRDVIPDSLRIIKQDHTYIGCKKNGNCSDGITT